MPLLMLCVLVSLSLTLCFSSATRTLLCFILCRLVGRLVDGCGAKNTYAVYFSVYNIFGIYLYPSICIYSTEWNAVYHFILFNFWTSVSPTKMFSLHPSLQYDSLCLYRFHCRWFFPLILLYRFCYYLCHWCIYYFAFWSISIRWLLVGAKAKAHHSNAIKLQF